MVSFGFRDRVAVAVSANAGTYAMPDLATPGPFGLGEADVDTDALRAFARRADRSFTRAAMRCGPESRPLWR
jgi:hypothetical protein